MAILFVGIDLAKNVSAVHGVNEAGKPELLQVLDHTVKVIAPEFVAPYRLSGKRGKNDAADAAAICEAVQWPNMRWPTRTPASCRSPTHNRFFIRKVRQQTHPQVRPAAGEPDNPQVPTARRASGPLPSGSYLGPRSISPTQARLSMCSLSFHGGACFALVQMTAGIQYR